MKRILLVATFFISLLSQAQSFQKAYQASYVDMMTYKSRIYILVKDSGSKHCIVKKDLDGNILWSKKYSFPAGVTRLFFAANAGKISVSPTGGSVTSFLSVDTLNGTISSDYVFFPCPPNPQNNSDKIVALNNGLVVKLGCNPATSKQTLFTTNSITGNTVSATSINTPTNLGDISYARITKAGNNSILLYGRTSVTNLLFFMKITDPVAMTNTGLHILKNQLPNDLDPDFATDVDTVGTTIFVLFRNNNTYTYIKTDTALTGYTAYTRPINNNFVSHIFYKSNTLYSGIYNVTGTTTCKPILSSVSDNFIPIQTISYPLVSLTNTGSATYPNRDFKVSASGSSVYFAYNDNNFMFSKSNNFGILNCTSTATLPAFTTLILTDSIVSGITTSLSPFTSYNNISIPSYSNIAYSNTLTCLSVGFKNNTSGVKREFVLSQLNSSEYIISSNLATLKEVKVFDVSGRMIINETDLNSEKVKINLENQPNGIYILKAVNSERSEKVFKLLKL